MPIALYLRVSTEEQRERQTINTQREFGERYCQLHGLPIHHVYADDGISGTVPLERRPEGGQILQAAKHGKFDPRFCAPVARLSPGTPGSVPNNTRCRPI